MPTIRDFVDRSSPTSGAWTPSSCWASDGLLIDRHSPRQGSTTEDLAARVPAIVSRGRRARQGRDCTAVCCDRGRRAREGVCDRSALADETLLLLVLRTLGRPRPAAVRCAPASRQHRVPDLTQPMTRTCHVLVADDEPHIGRIIKMKLEQGPFRVTLAYDGREALECWSAKQDSRPRAARPDDAAAERPRRAAPDARARAVAAPCPASSSPPAGQDAAPAGRDGARRDASSSPSRSARRSCMRAPPSSPASRRTQGSAGE